MTIEPEINEQFQSLHINTDSDIDWVAIQIIERDICLLYHQLSNYSFIMDDLYYGNVFNLPYWQFLDIKGIDAERRKFIRGGSLVLIFAMVSEEVGGAGHYLSNDRFRYKNCKRNIDAFVPENEDEKLIVNSIKTGFDLIDKNKIGDLSMFENTTEIHKRFVRSYFEAIAKNFKTKKYYKDGR